MKETTCMIVAKISESDEKSALCPISSPITIWSEERFNQIVTAISELGYGIVVLPNLPQK